MIPKKLTDEIEQWIKERKYGSLLINFSEGRIVNVYRNESFKVEIVCAENPEMYSASSYPKPVA